MGQWPLTHATNVFLHPNQECDPNALAPETCSRCSAGKAFGSECAQPV